MHYSRTLLSNFGIKMSQIMIAEENKDCTAVKQAGHHQKKITSAHAVFLKIIISSCAVTCMKFLIIKNILSNLHCLQPQRL